MTAFSKEAILYLPFWRMKPRVEGIHLVSYADLIRLANLPKVINRAFESAPLYFWSPAFKVSPALSLIRMGSPDYNLPAGREDK